MKKEKKVTIMCKNIKSAKKCQNFSSALLFHEVIFHSKQYLYVCLYINILLVYIHVVCPKVQSKKCTVIENVTLVYGCYFDVVEFKMAE